MNKIAALIFFFAIFSFSAMAEDKKSCRAIDTREFGLVSTGDIDEPWSEAQLIEKYGQPCAIIELGEVFMEKSEGRIIELDAKTIMQDKQKLRATAIKKQFIYSGDFSSKTSVFTIINGVVVKKEKIF
ncbi:MAG TPA: hypothetical protein VJ202_04220 [Thermodesulfobacteriota bacterium]|nr:hypothetical protein [Thermodesulfobacteriota bacterium]